MASTDKTALAELKVVFDILSRAIAF